VISFIPTETGTYGISVEANNVTIDRLRLRLMISVDVDLEHWQAEGSLEDPAHCEKVITVGAIEHDVYNVGTLWSDSGRGPTMDGRVKPDIVAPSNVLTSLGTEFVGTSAAAPHVAGAIALYIDAFGLDPLTAGRAVLDDAQPLDSPVPNNSSGYGKLLLDLRNG